VGVGVKIHGKAKNITVRTVLKSNKKKLIETDAKLILLTDIYMTTHFSDIVQALQ
jgi:hypothetical protein